MQYLFLPFTLPDRRNLQNNYLRYTVMSLKAVLIFLASLVLSGVHVIKSTCKLCIIS